MTLPASRQFLRDLEKPDNELESEAGRMSLQQLRRQNQPHVRKFVRVHVWALERVWWLIQSATWVVTGKPVLQTAWPLFGWQFDYLRPQGFC